MKKSRERVEGEEEAAVACMCHGVGFECRSVRDITNVACISLVGRAGRLAKLIKSEIAPLQSLPAVGACR